MDNLNAPDPWGLTDLWRFVSLNEYAPPPEPAREAVRGHTGRLWRRLRPAPPQAVVPARACALTDDPSAGSGQALLDRAAPRPAWTGATAALARALQPWLVGARPAGQVLVSGPYGGGPEIIAGWAASHGLSVVEPPAPEDLLTGGAAWLARLIELDADPLALPRLEHCYLRHPAGLTLIRRLLDRLAGGERRYLVGCASWAWAYLARAVQIELRLAAPLTPAALVAEGLGRWLAALAETGGIPPAAFRLADSGQPVLPPAPGAALPGGGFLRHLAARSRGNAGLAWAIWRRSLCQSPAAPAQPTAALGVQPWNDLALPVIPDPTHRDHPLVLHALLVHDGLPAGLLPELLPLIPGEVGRSLARLQAVGLVAQDAGLWRVTPLGYPAVRRLLASEGFLVDAL
jgi:hypothetical protein